MADSEKTPVNESVEETGTATVAAPERMELSVAIEDVGPCKKHVRVKVPRSSIDDTFSTILVDYTDRASVPGFRVGHVPTELVKKRFKKELSEQVKQRVLMASLEQLGDESKLEPINEPNLDLESIEIPDTGDFEYEFDVEVRPTFDLPNYKGLSIKRPVRTIEEKDVDDYLAQFLEQYGQLVPVEAPAQTGDFVTVNITVTHDGKQLAKIEDVSVRVRPTLRFQDSELAGFDKFISGVTAGETRETDLTVSMEADTIEMRGNTVHVVFDVLDVKRLNTPELTQDFLLRIGAYSEESLKEQIRGMLERQVKYEQRQSCRRQVLEQITESADWELPETLVARQVENALRRESLELQQAGFTSREILARENELRQRSLSMTRQNLKEHFVLDRLADEEKLEVTEDDLNAEISAMALSRGENPRRVRARLIKSGAIENLDAQIRERKAVDVILDNAQFEDVPMPTAIETEVEALNRSVCGARSSEVEEEHDHDHDCDDPTHDHG
ncbi:MAG TPA: trigger factor [Planctomicrobium sp.]|nr:trigger factor [Planctomicrobium sp.]